MLVTVNSKRQSYYGIGTEVKSLGTGNIPLLVVVDPGKTNMAIVVGTIYGEIIEYYEITGKGMDTSLYCEEFRDFLLKKFRNCNVVEFSQEQAIQKKGFEYYTSQMVLTEIRAILLMLGKELNGRKPFQINNWSWKSAILPDGYRGHNEKGSLRYLKEVMPELGVISHDVSDVICMYLFRVNHYGNSTIKCDKSESTDFDYSCSIVDTKLVPKINTKVFEYNTAFSFEENLAFFINRSKSTGVCRLPVESIDPVYFFEYGALLTPNSTPHLIIKRKGDYDE